MATTAEGGKIKNTAGTDNKFFLPNKRTPRSKANHQGKEKVRNNQPNSSTASVRTGEIVIWYTNADVLTKEKLTELKCRIKNIQLLHML